MVYKNYLYAPLRVIECNCVLHKWFTIKVYFVFIYYTRCYHQADTKKFNLTQNFKLKQSENAFVQNNIF